MHFARKVSLLWYACLVCSIQINYSKPSIKMLLCKDWLKKNKCRRFIVHYASLTCKFHAAPAHFTEHIQSVLITGFKSLPGLPRVKGLIAAYIWRNPNSSNAYPHRVCNFRTLSSGSDWNTDDQYSKLKRFIVLDLTDWAITRTTMTCVFCWLFWNRFPSNMYAALFVSKSKQDNRYYWFTGDGIIHDTHNS